MKADGFTGPTLFPPQLRRCALKVLHWPRASRVSCHPVPQLGLAHPDLHRAMQEGRGLWACQKISLDSLSAVSGHRGKRRCTVNTSSYGKPQELISAPIHLGKKRYPPGLASQKTPTILTAVIGPRGASRHPPSFLPSHLEKFLLLGGFVGRMGVRGCCSPPTLNRGQASVLRVQKCWQEKVPADIPVTPTTAPSSTAVLHVSGRTFSVLVEVL